MAKYGKGWIPELVAGATFTSPARKAAAESQLGLMVDMLEREAGGQTPPPAPPPVTKPSIFASPGWFGVRYDALASPAELADAGIKWIVAGLSHGVDAAGGHSLNDDDKTNQAWLAAGKAKAYRDAGVKVGGWGWQQGVAAAHEADIAVDYIEAWTLDLWIANGEEAWKGNDQPAKYAVALDAMTPASFPVAWSVLGAASGTNVYPFDYKAFTSRGWPILPQAYPQQAPEYQLSLCIDHAMRAGIPFNLLAPTIANYDVQAPGAFKPSLAQWKLQLALARARGVAGFSVWAHDFQVADVKLLAKDAA